MNLSWLVDHFWIGLALLPVLLPWRNRRRQRKAFCCVVGEVLTVTLVEHHLIPTLLGAFVSGGFFAGYVYLLAKWITDDDDDDDDRGKRARAALRLKVREYLARGIPARRALPQGS
jgi:hypothetical protein